MYYGMIKTADVANGAGVRVSLFVSGCTNHCKDCFQPQTWDFCYGQPYTKETEEYLLKELSNGFYRGITILGGEPFEPENQREIVKLLRRIKTELPQKDIWCYTGFTYEKDLMTGGRKHCEVTDEILGMLDVLVDGKFVTELKDIRLKFKGSSNQRVIDMNKTRCSNTIVLSEYD